GEVPRRSHRSAARAVGPDAVPAAGRGAVDRLDSAQPSPRDEREGAREVVLVEHGPARREPRRARRLVSGDRREVLAQGAERDAHGELEVDLRLTWTGAEAHSHAAEHG